MKLCLSCMKKIPLLAGRCPHCLDENQGVYGRIILLILFLLGLFVIGIFYLNIDPKDELTKLLIEIGVK